MLAFIRRLWAKLVRRRAAPTPPITAQRVEGIGVIGPASPPIPPMTPMAINLPAPPKRKRRAKAPKEPHELAVDKHNKQKLLDSLGDYFEAAARLKMVAPDDYSFFARTGCVVTQAYSAPEGGITETNHAPIFAGGIFIPKYAASDKDEAIYPSFVYFARMRKPKVWPAGPVPHLLYRVVLIYRTADLVGWDWPRELLIARDRAGRFTVLGEPHIKQQQLPPSSHGHRHERVGKVVTHVSFGLPQWLIDHWNGKKEKHPGLTIHDYAAGLFTMAYETYREAVTALLISAQKHGQRAVFAVQLQDARNMFRDRDLKAASTPGGRLRPIFHYVREHDREVVTVAPDGTDTTKIVPVRTHYRGLRDFFWNGFHVTISWPDRANTLYAKNEALLMGEHAEDVRPDERSKWLSMRQAAKRVAEAVFNYDERVR